MVTLPGGISSTIRRLPDLDGSPFKVARAQGAYLFGPDGKRYVDYAMAMGATILGHAHPAVVEACVKALENGSMPGFTHDREEAAAEALVQDAGRLAKATFLTTGSEAVHLACRIARKTTGRGTIAKIAAGFDGWYDDLAFGWYGAEETAMGGSRPYRNGMTLLRWNDIADLESLFVENGDVAAVLIEPMLANANSLMPAPSYLADVGRICRKHGAMVIADEVLMGFRLRPGISSPAMGLDPDLATLGKAIGSGLPVAAVLGTEEAFEVVADGRAMRAGTYHGNPLVTSAVLATLAVLRSRDYGQLLGRGQTFRKAIEAAVSESGIKVTASGIDSVFSLWFADHAPASYAEALPLVRPELSLELHLEMRRNGVLTIPGAWSRIFLSFAHAQADCDETVEAYRNSARRMVELGLA
ncbi:MAG: aminotransferase class III-fold pyridoxal phosphate-dependent enzyme [Alphaproteobacteria bacterium]|nr:aminotransferase class III-fold pyridoxal phosphate-dependent enzyme [Alphaproteobacteria bacterium]